MSHPYRADIDGLRALAIIPVVLFHAEIMAITGGYVGVDIFFVISGYLITTIIANDLAAGRFSLAMFYERRIRRIFPALFLVLFASLGMAGWLFLPPDFGNFGKSLAGAAGFVSNIVFYNEAGYFDPSGWVKPLLHTWTLAVEEQFYVIFPLVLMLVARFCGVRWLFWSVAALFVISFVVCEASIADKQDKAAFYLLQNRAFELMLGAMAALLPAALRDRLPRHVLGVVGLGLIIYAIGWFDHKTRFPGAYALVPTLGAVFIILSSPQGLVGRLLGWRPLVGIGKISYSLYLWHWPVLVFAQYYLIVPITPEQKWQCIAVSFVLAALTWHFVEQPCRDRKNFTRRTVFMAAAIASLLVIALGYAAYKTDGASFRYDRSILSLMEATKFPVEGTVFHHGVHKPLGVVDKDPSFLVWGDSHANAFAAGFDIWAQKEGMAGVLLKRPGCMPTTAPDSNPKEVCIEFNKQSMKWLDENKSVKVVVLAARWSVYPRWWADGVIQGGTPESRASYQRALEYIVAKLNRMGKTVWIVAEVPPVYGYTVPTALARLQISGRELDIRPTLSGYMEQQQHNTPIFQQLEKQKVNIFYPHKFMCDQERCRVRDGDQSLYFDDDHISSYGAAQVAPYLLAAIRDN